jgi:GT2 family glycosyltransferase
MISTRNRCADLARTCAALASLDPAPDEVLICADGCTDGTVDFLRKHHPTFTVLVQEPARGSIASRDRMMRASTAEVVLSLDDDSYPIERDFFTRLATLFTGNPNLAVADFPQRTDEHPESLTVRDFGFAKQCASFSSAGAALRRSIYLELGGYPPFFFHAYEEPDYALRCHAAGYEVRHEIAGSIRHHYTGAQRNEMRTHHYHARNELWSVLMRCPFPQLLLVAAFRVLRQSGYAVKRGGGWILREPVWWWKALQGLGPSLAARQPLPWRVYLSWMRLLRDGC